MAVYSLLFVFGKMAKIRHFKNHFTIADSLFFAKEVYFLFLCVIRKLILFPSKRKKYPFISAQLHTLFCLLLIFFSFVSLCNFIF